MTKTRLLAGCIAAAVAFVAAATAMAQSPPTRLRGSIAANDGKTVTTVTFDENAGKTLLVVHDLYPSKEALDSGSTGAMPEALDQLDELLASLGSSTETK